MIKILRHVHFPCPRSLLQNPESNLARRFDSHCALAGTEPVERAVVMRDDLLGFRQIIVNRQMIPLIVFGMALMMMAMEAAAP